MNLKSKKYYQAVFESNKENVSLKQGKVKVTSEKDITRPFHHPKKQANISHNNC